MDERSKTRRLRQAVGIFHDVEALQTALCDLVADGIDASRITVVAVRAALERLGWRFPEEGGGKSSEGTDAVEAGHGGNVGPFPMQFIEIGVAGTAGPLLASSGEWAELLLQWARAQDPSFRCLLEHRLDKAHARFLQRQLETGAVTLWIRVRDGEEERRACRSLLRNSSDRVQVHDIDASLP
jgi:hypothetical protein